MNSEFLHDILTDVNHFSNDSLPVTFGYKYLQLYKIEAGIATLEEIHDVFLYIEQQINNVDLSESDVVRYPAENMKIIKACDGKYVDYYKHITDNPTNSDSLISFNLNIVQLFNLRLILGEK